MSNEPRIGLPAHTIEEILVEAIGNLGADDSHFTRKLAAGIAEVIERNNRELARGLQPRG